MSSSDLAEPAPLPLVRWRLAQVLVGAICLQLAAIGALLAVDAVEPADAEELLTAIAVPLYPLLGSVVTFYFAARRLGPTDPPDYGPDTEPRWYGDHAWSFEDEYDHDDDEDQDQDERAATRPAAPAISQADADRIRALAKWALGTATVALAVVMVCAVCGRTQPPRSW